VIVGGVEVTPVLDAVGLIGPYDVLYPDVPAEAWDRTAGATRSSSRAASGLPCASFLLRSGGRTVLVDTGVGPPGLWDWEPEVEGRLVEEVDPADIDIVFLTHLHIDHVGWNADADGRPLFSRYVVHEDALAFARGHDERPHVKRTILTVGFETVSGETDLAPGVVAFEAPGHYPGHMALRLGDEGIVLADVAVHPALLDHPEWRYVSDLEYERSVQTRRELLPELEGKVVLCGHYPDGVRGAPRASAGARRPLPRRRRGCASRRPTGRRRSRASTGR
jgi:glyoxylase-like metal-dependent hydrolase (beta-lactamase superfamily II)